ncbi:hypothetical protein [Clostridium coskatii]|uniref:Uncharacterized protein n=1 Tax=Clostridium coskatii TaxID=1705578 RepID=A0A170NL46_9CLOT|nr:hypothetical protein [Clostridium coskatii]OAA91323.1 hypothetical protein WX73_01733 [Clostridium coskatii]OBR93955.1 hypothetical protein CLCOS_20910 [Clostridium coskatii]
MVLTENEAFLLALGYTFDISDVRIKTTCHKILDKRDMKVRDIYMITDYGGALKLYRRYKKTYIYKVGRFRVPDFIDDTLIVQLDRKRSS